MAGRITGGGGQWALRIRQLQGLPGRRGRGYCFGYLTRRMSSAAQLRWSLTLVEIATRRQRPAAATRGNKSLARPVSLTASAASGDRRQAASALSSGGESRPVSHQTVSRCSRRGRLPIKVVGDTARCRPSSEDVERGGTVAGEAEAGAGGRRGAGGGEGAPGH